VDDRDDAVSFAALLDAYWLDSEVSDQRDAAVGEYDSGTLPLHTGRTVMVVVAAATVVAAVMTAVL
jgi:hypothetical protein